jgi:hypothetical protein
MVLKARIKKKNDKLEESLMDEPSFHSDEFDENQPL